MNLRDEAEALAIAIELGFARVGEAIEWADQQIIALEQPPYALIEVSTAGKAHLDEMAHLLREVPGDVDVAAAVRRVVARMARELDAGAATPERIARALYYLHIEERWPDPEAAYEMGRLDDAFELAYDGTYGTVEQATRDLREFLRRFAS